MAQVLDGPVTVTGALVVELGLGPGGAGHSGREPHFEVKGVLSRFANIVAFGSIEAFGPMKCSRLDVTIEDVIVGGTPLLAGLQAVQGTATNANNEAARALAAVNSIQNVLNFLVNQVN